MTAASRPTIVAQPLEDGEWRVCSYRDGLIGTDHTMGYIGELGGTYEVHLLTVPPQRSYVGTFKEAMEFFRGADREG